MLPDVPLHEVATRLEISRAMLGFIETGRRGLQPHILARMIRVYAMTPEQEGKLFKLLEKDASTSKSAD